MGEFLRTMPKNVGAKGSVVSGSEREPVKDDTPTLREIGLTKKQSATAQKLAAIRTGLFVRHLQTNPRCRIGPLLRDSPQLV